MIRAIGAAIASSIEASAFPCPAKNRRRGKNVPKKGESRQRFAVQLPITADELAALRAAAKAERQTLGNWMARLALVEARKIEARKAKSAA
jgi:hypothetical protein